MFPCGNIRKYFQKFQSSAVWNKTKTYLSLLQGAKSLPISLPTYLVISSQLTICRRSQMDVKKVKKGRKLAPLTLLWFMLVFEKSYFWTPNTLFFHNFNPKVILLFRMKMYKLKKTMFPCGNIGRIKVKPLTAFLFSRWASNSDCPRWIRWRENQENRTVRTQRISCQENGWSRMFSFPISAWLAYSADGWISKEAQKLCKYLHQPTVRISFSKTACRDPSLFCDKSEVDPRRFWFWIEL